MNKPRNWSLPRKGLLVIAIPLVALVIVTLVFGGLLRSQRQQQELVTRTLDVRRQIQLVLTLLVDAETGGRGYALTGRRDFLEPLDAAHRRLPAQIARLQRVVAGDSTQRRRAAVLEQIVEERLEVLDQLQDAVQRTGVNPRGIEPLLLDGKGVMDRARDLVEAMQVEEQRIQGIRLEQLARADRRSRFVVAGGLLGGLLGGLVASAFFLKSIVSRVRQLQGNADLLAEGRALRTLPPGGDEIGALGRRLQTASELLRVKDEQVAEARRELERTVSLLRATLDATTDGIVAVDDGGRMLVRNQRFHDMFDLPDEPVEEDPAATWDPILARLKDPQATLEELQPWIERPDAVGSLVVELADGSLYEVCFHPQRLGDAIIGRVWTIRDVTEARRHQAAIERARTEAERAREEAERAREEAVRANEAKSEFLSRMSHELRTPLNAVLGFGQLLDLSTGDPRHKESVAQILKAGKHLLELINEVLDISRIESGKVSLSLEDVNVGEVVAEVVDLLGPLAASRDVTLVVTHDPRSRGTARADRQRLKQVMLNLVANAVKYNRDGGTVGVGVHDGPGETLRIDVADTGPGIPEDKLGRLFTPFDRIGAEQTDVEGTGLGLALSKRLVDAMGGSLAVESRVGEGSTFTVVLSAAVEPVPEPARLDGPDTEALRVGRPGPAGERPGGDGSARHKILYVEDNLSNLRLVEQLLDCRPDIHLLTAIQGGMGLELARSHRPDLILLDLHLPDMHGADVLALLRRDPATQSTPVVILSADATPGQIERLRKAGADDYLAKPLDLRRLLHVLDRVTTAGTA